MFQHVIYTIEAASPVLLAVALLGVAWLLLVRQDGVPSRKESER